MGIIGANTSCVTGAPDKTKVAFSWLANGILLTLLLSRAARSLGFASGNRMTSLASRYTRQDLGIIVMNEVMLEA